ncbi:MAG: hypothetical protein M3680_11440 [Myxococcota bacterium]|nr:hypothetical protein [Myxococcota bacterium]
MPAVRLVLLAVVTAGCASGGNASEPSDAAPVIIDGVVESFVDAARPDATVTPPPDAAPVIADAAPLPPDACVPMATEKLVNPAFDSTPVGTGWTQTLINPQFPLVTDQDGAAEHTAPFKAWLGGFVAPTAGQTVTDVLFQQVVIPATTTTVVLTGFYDVRTAEAAADPMVWDSATLSLVDTNDVVLATVLTLSNRTPKTAWTAINHTFTQNLAGRTVRLRMTSSNDDSNATSFYFDTLSLQATHCP